MDGDSSKTLRLVYDDAPGKGGLDDLVLAFDGSGNVANRYLHGPAVDQLFSDESTVDGLLWSLADRQGTVTDWLEYDDVTDETTVFNHVEYDSFGNKISQMNTGHEITLGGYTGRWHDPETGLTNHRARWTQNGRWLSEDPIGFDGGDTNLRRYVGNSPTNATDPSGLVPPTDNWGGADWNAGVARRQTSGTRTITSRTPASFSRGLTPQNSRGLSPNERRFLEFFFFATMPGWRCDEAQRARVSRVLSQVTIYENDGGPTRPIPFIALELMGNGAVTLGPSQYYSPGNYPPGVPLLGHETFHSVYADGTGGTGAFLVAYGFDSARAGVMTGAPYRGNLSEMWGHAMQAAIADILRKYPDLASDPPSPALGCATTPLEDELRLVFPEHLSDEIERYYGDLLPRT